MRNEMLSRVRINRQMWVVVLAFAVLAVWPSLTAAQGTVLPADAGMVQASPANERVVYAVAGTQVYRSSNKGLTWEKMGATPSRIRSLALARNDTNRLYAGTESAGLWRSLDGGRTWIEGNVGLGTGPGVVTEVSAVAVNPEDDALLYAATGVWLGTSRARLTPTQISFSIDGGSTWLPFAELQPENRPVVRLMPVDGLPLALLAFDDQGNSAMHQVDLQALLSVAISSHESQERRSAAAEVLTMLVETVPAPTAYPARYRYSEGAFSGLVGG